MELTTVSPLVLVVVGGLNVLIGALIGWILSRNSGAPTRKLRTAEPKQNPQQLAGIMTNVQQVIHNVSDDVKAHSSRLQAVNDDIRAQHENMISCDPIVAQTVGQLIQLNAHLHENLVRSEKRLQEQSRQLEIVSNEARRDPLTQVFNRRAFDKCLATQIAELTPQKTPFSLVMIDIDHFKQVNDRHGHAIGDKLLQGLTRFLSNRLPNGHLLARIGGEEFAIVLKATDVDDAMSIADQLRASIEMHVFHCDQVALRITISAGVAEAMLDESAESLLKRADSALYSGKHAGRNVAVAHQGCPSAENVACETALLHPTA